MSRVFANNSHLIFGKTSSVVGEGFIPPLIEKPPPCGQRIQGGENGLEIFNIRQGKSCLSLPDGLFRLVPDSALHMPGLNNGGLGVGELPGDGFLFRFSFCFFHGLTSLFSMRGFLGDIQFSTVNKMDIANLCRIDSSPEIVNFLQSPL